MAASAIVVHSLAHAVAALQAAAQAQRPVVLLSAVDAGLSAGAGWWREMVKAARDSVPGSPSGVRADALLDCGGDAGAVQAALREGVEAIVFRGPPQVAARLADIAASRGARVLNKRPQAALDPADDFFAPPDALRRRILTVLSEGIEISGPDAEKSQDTGQAEILRGNIAGTG